MPHVCQTAVSQRSLYRVARIDLICDPSSLASWSITFDIRLYKATLEGICRPPLLQESFPQLFSFHPPGLSDDIAEGAIISFAVLPPEGPFLLRRRDTSSKCLVDVNVLNVVCILVMFDVEGDSASRDDPPLQPANTLQVKDVVDNSHVCQGLVLQ